MLSIPVGLAVCHWYFVKCGVHLINCDEWWASSTMCALLLIMCHVIHLCCLIVKLHLFDLLWIFDVTVRTAAAEVLLHFMAVVGISKDSKDTFTISAQWNFPKNLEALTRKPLYWQLCVAEESTKLWWQGLWLYGIDRQKPILVNFVHSACETVQTTCLYLNSVVLQGLQ